MTEHPLTNKKAYSTASNSTSSTLEATGVARQLPLEVQEQRLWKQALAASSL